MPCWSVNSFSLCCKNCSRAIALVRFSRANSNESSDRQDLFTPHNSIACYIESAFPTGLMYTIFSRLCASKSVKLSSNNVELFFKRSMFKPSDDYNDSVWYRQSGRQDQRSLNDKDNTRNRPLLAHMVQAQLTSFCLSSCVVLRGIT